MTDISDYDDWTLSLSEARNAAAEFNVICTVIEIMAHNIVPLTTELSVMDFLWQSVKTLLSLRPSEQYTEYQRGGSNKWNTVTNDRVFPLETVEIQQFRRKHDYDIGEVIIHTGPYANEYTRSLNALAVTVGNDIYFRDNAFDTGSEEGRKTLAHELTHVGQHKENRITGGVSLKKLEEEAVNEEKGEGYETDPCIKLVYRGKICRIPKAKLNGFVKELAGGIERRIEEQKNGLREEDYLKLLTAYEGWLKGGEKHGFLGI